MIHSTPDYLKKPITLRLECRQCRTKRLHHCVAVGVKTGTHQQVTATCLMCERAVTR